MKNYTTNNAFSLPNNYLKNNESLAAAFIIKMILDKEAHFNFDGFENCWNCWNCCNLAPRKITCDCRKNNASKAQIFATLENKAMHLVNFTRA